MSRDQHAEQNHNIKISNIYFERVEQFKYLGTTLTDQNSINEEIKSSVLSFGAESFVLHFPNQQYKDQIIQNRNFPHLFCVGVCLILSH